MGRPRCTLQGQAESYLERLHKMVENDLNEFIDGAVKVDAWAKWRENLIGLTDVTRSHFEKLVMELCAPCSCPLSTLRV